MGWEENLLFSRVGGLSLPVRNGDEQLLAKYEWNGLSGFGSEDLWLFATQTFFGWTDSFTMNQGHSRVSRPFPKFSPWILQQQHP